MLIVLNNKSNLNKYEFEKYVTELENINSDKQLVLCPSDIYLNSFDLNNIEKGSQNVSSYKNGAHTGEVSATQLKDLGVKYCIVGHSERRKNNHETNSDIKNKIKLLLENDITPILCIGEEKEEKDSKKTSSIIEKELSVLMDEELKEKVVIAYEPIWAIGTGISATSSDINEVVLQIRKMLPKNVIIYGGSVTENNIKEINANTQLDGYLLGNVSLDVKRLIELLNLV